MALNKDFGAFVLHEKIGSGGMASVYLGIQKSLDRQVVLKILYPHLAEDEKLIARFEREAREAARLRHENIVQVIDYGKCEDVYFIAMEFVEGLDLQKLLKQHGPPPVEMALLILRDTCRGLEHAHAHRVIHRDIKPGNLMLTPEGTVKIMDFGLARRAEESTTMTMPGEALGTAAYMSPEQATGGKVDERSDIFSVGVVAYELLGGARPFKGDTYSSVLHEILTVEPPALGNLNPKLPADVVAIVHKMLQKDAARRPSGISVVRGDLETIIEEMGLHRGKDLLCEYARDPARVAEVLRSRRGPVVPGSGLPPEIPTAAVAAPAESAPIPPPPPVVTPPPSEPAAAAPAPPAPPQPAAERRTESAPAPATAAPAPGPSKSPSPPAQKKVKPVKPATGRSDSLAQVRTILIVALAVLVVLLGVRACNPPKKDKDAVPPSGSPVVKTLPPEIAPQIAPAPAPTPAITPSSGSLSITSRPPGGRIVIDGRPHGARTDARIEGLTAGEHQVRVEKPGYVPQQSTIVVEAGREKALALTLAADTLSRPARPAAGAAGTLLLAASPSASFYVDDTLRATNQSRVELPLAPGRHRVRMEHPRFDPVTFPDVVVEARRTTTKHHRFPMHERGSIRVKMRKNEWAQVLLDDVPQEGRAPLVLEGIKPGPHRVDLLREGYVSESGPKPVEVGVGKEVVVEFRLKKAKK